MEVLKDETTVSVYDKETVKQLMRILLHFSQITKANTLHALVEKIMVAKYEAD